MSFGETVRRLRKERRWTQQELGAQAGFPPGTISHIENGRNDNPTQETLDKLAAAFGVTVDDLLGRNDEAAGPLPVATLRAFGVDERRFPLYRRQWDRSTRDWRIKFLGTLRMRAMADATLRAMTEEVEAEISALEDQIEEADEPDGEAHRVQQRVAV